MGENKKDVKENKEEDIKPEEKSGDVVVEKKNEVKKNEEVNEELNLDEAKKEKKVSQADEELPEEIKKKLEKKKIERAKKKQIKRKKKKVARTVKTGRAYIKATYNNTIITLTDLNGDVISWASAGIAGFKGPKKATPYAAQIITKIACLKAKEEFGLEEVAVFVKGIGTGRESAIRALNMNGLNVNSIKDITPIPHNGCRARKPRRV